MPKKMLSSSEDHGNCRSIVPTRAPFLQLGKVADIVADEWSGVGMQVRQ